MKEAFFTQSLRTNVLAWDWLIVQPVVNIAVLTTLWSLCTCILNSINIPMKFQSLESGAEAWHTAKDKLLELKCGKHQFLFGTEIIGNYIQGYIHELSRFSFTSPTLFNCGNTWLEGENRSL